MKRGLNILATVLMVGGIVLLGYAGLQYVRARPSSSNAGWSRAQYAKGREIAAKLATPQKVTIPGRLKHQSMAPAGAEPAVRIVAPQIDLNAPVVETPPVNGVWEVADWAVGHLTTTPNPGADGNMALSAHDDIKGEVFKRLGELKPGDDIQLYTRHSVFTYVVVNRLLVDPSDVQVLNPTRVPTVTLISCSPYWVDTQRIVVQAVLKSQRTA